MKNTTKFMRVQKDSNYVVINKEFLKNKNLSWKAKGILTYVLALPDDWKLYLSELQEHSKDGSDSLYSGIKELIKSGHVRKEEIRINGRFEGVSYIISEKPNQVRLPPYAGKPDTGKPVSENPALLSNNKLSNNKLSNKLSSDSKTKSSEPNSKANLENIVDLGQDTFINKEDFIKPNSVEKTEKPGKPADPGNNDASVTHQDQQEGVSNPKVMVRQPPSKNNALKSSLGGLGKNETSGIRTQAIDYSIGVAKDQNLYDTLFVKTNIRAIDALLQKSDNNIDIFKSYFEAYKTDSFYGDKPCIPNRVLKAASNGLAKNFKPLNKYSGLSGAEKRKAIAKEELLKCRSVENSELEAEQQKVKKNLDEFFVKAGVI